MARKALLTAAQCSQIRTLFEEGARAIELAKAFGVSESSLYKVLDGSYKARPDEPERPVLSTVVPDKPVGVTPSLFTHSVLCPELTPTIKQMIERARQIDDVELDELTIAAAALVMARARLNRALAHTH